MISLQCFAKLCANKEQNKSFYLPCYIKFYYSLKAKNYLNYFNNLKKAPLIVPNVVSWAIDTCGLFVKIPCLEF